MSLGAVDLPLDVSELFEVMVVIFDDSVVMIGASLLAVWIYFPLAA